MKTISFSFPNADRGVGEGVFEVAHSSLGRNGVDRVSRKFSSQ